MISFSSQITVIYIAWGGLPIDTVKNFFESYEKFQAGYPHNLIIISRDYEAESEEFSIINDYTKKFNAKLINTPNIGQDFGAYYTGAKETNAEYILCLNSHSVIMCDDWILKFIRAKEKFPQMELIGSGGGWHKSISYYNYYNEILKQNNKKNWMYHIQKNKIRIINLFDRFKNFQHFPNPFIRTNAFLIKKSLYIDFIEKECHKKLPKNKLQAYRMENGNRSLSRYVLKRGYNYCVVGRNNQIFMKDEFNISGTYHSEFENYIVKDKQIKIFENADIKSRKCMENAAWTNLYYT